MTASLSTVRIVKMDGIKSAWHISNEDARIVDDAEFVALRSTYSLRKMIWEGMTDLDSRPPFEKFSLPNCVGLQKVKDLRQKQMLQNDIVNDLEEGDAAAPCSLFAGGGTPSKKPKPMLRKAADVRKMRQESKVLHVALQQRQVPVLTAPCKNDCLWVAFEGEAMAALMSFIYQSGYSDEGLDHDRPPSGIWKRVDIHGPYFVIPYKDKSKYKRKRTLDAAMQFLARGDDDDSENDHDSDNDHGNDDQVSDSLDTVLSPDTSNSDSLAVVSVDSPTACERDSGDNPDNVL